MLKKKHSLSSLKKTSLMGIKKNSHPIKVIGGMFFLLTIIFAFIWILGDWNVEPIAFTLGVISSAFLSLPSIAEYFYPERKPVSLMTFDEIIDFIPKTDFENDWHGITREWSSERFLKEDPRLRIRSKFTDDGIQNENFIEKWANCHPNQRAVGYWFELYYDGAFLDRVILVSVDGGRATIPTPDIKTGKIKYYDYAFSVIMDVKKNVDEYITRSGLEVDL